MRSIIKNKSKWLIAAENRSKYKTNWRCRCQKFSGLYTKVGKLVFVIKKAEGRRQKAEGRRKKKEKNK